jgi:hypothetical protein
MWAQSVMLRHIEATVRRIESLLLRQEMLLEEIRDSLSQVRAVAEGLNDPKDV